MKRWMMPILTLSMLALLTACGGSGDVPSPGEGDAPEVKNVDLSAVYSAMEEVCDWWTDGYMEDIEGEMLEMYYPGLAELETRQLIARAPMMSSAVNEVVMVECGSQEDADKAQEILQGRIDYQVGDDTNPGGAWYPESIEAWKESSVQRQGNYLALLAVADTQDQLEEIFNQAFE